MLINNVNNYCHVNDEILHYAEREGAKGRKHETASLCFISRFHAFALSRYSIVNTTIFSFVCFLVVFFELLFNK